MRNAGTCTVAATLPPAVGLRAVCPLRMTLHPNSAMEGTVGRTSASQVRCMEDVRCQGDRRPASVMRRHAREQGFALHSAPPRFVALFPHTFHRAPHIGAFIMCAACDTCRTGGIVNAKTCSMEDVIRPGGPVGVRKAQTCTVRVPPSPLRGGIARCVSGIRDTPTPAPQGKEVSVAQSHLKREEWRTQL